MSEEIKISGTVETCLPLETFPSGFSKRVLVINTGGKYPQLIPVEFVKDNAELLTGLRKNQEVTASVNLRGSQFNGKYYSNIQGWKLDKGDRQPAPAKPAPRQQDDNGDEIPF
jgi:hypothetical protein